MIWTSEECDVIPEAPDAVTVSCGNPANNDCLDDYCSSAEELHEVRCCSDSQIDNYQQRNGCEVWAESQFLSVGEPGGGTEGPGCVHDADLSTALATCSGDGARLCTLEEIQGSCTAGTGCGHDGDMIWTDDTCSGDGETGCAPEDLDLSGQVDFGDLVLVLSNWGGCCSADVDGDGQTSFQDLLTILSAWGSCQANTVKSHMYWIAPSIPSVLLN